MERQQLDLVLKSYKLSVEEFPGYLETVLRSNNPTESTLQELANIDNLLLTVLAENRQKLLKQLELEKQRKDQEEQAKIAAAAEADDAAQKEIVKKQEQQQALQQQQ